MVDYKPGLSSDLTNASLMSERIEREAFEEDFNIFIKYLTLEDWTKIYKCIDTLRYQNTNSGNESSTRGTLALPLARQPEDVKMWSVSQNASDSTWSTTNKSTICFQNDVPPKKDKSSQIDDNQTKILEEVFSSSQYIIGKKRRALAELLIMSEKQVSRWFEHRRRRMRLEQSETNISMTFGPATLVRRQPKHVGAHLAVRQDNLFDTGYVCSSNLSTEGDISGKMYSVLTTLNS